MVAFTDRVVAFTVVASTDNKRFRFVDFKIECHTIGFAATNHLSYN